MRRFPVLTHLALLFVAMAWGGTFVAIKYLVEEIGAIGVVFLRIVPASLCFALLLLVTVRPGAGRGARWPGVPDYPRALWKKLLVIAICGGVVNNLALAYGQGYISAAMASLVATANPIWTAVFARLLIGEPLTARKLSGIAVAFCGFLIVLLRGSGEASFSVDNALGMLIVMAGPLGWAIYTVISKPLLIEHEPHVIAGVTTILSGFLLAPVFAVDPAFFGQLAEIGVRGWLAVLAMSVVAIFLCYIIWYRGLRKLTPTQVAVYLYLVPFFGVLWAWLLLGETVTAWLLLGGATILAGVIVTNSGRRAAADDAGRAVTAEPRVAEG